MWVALKSRLVGMVVFKRVHRGYESAGSLCMIVTRLAWMEHKLVSSNRSTRLASLAFCRAIVS